MRPSRLLLVLAFIALVLTVIAAVNEGSLRDNALIIWVFLTGFVALDFALSWRGRLQLEASAPAEVFAGETSQISIRSDQPPPRLFARFDWPLGLEGPPEAALAELSEDGRATIPIRARQRGTWRIEAIWLLWQSRFRLLEFTPKAALDLSIAVVPNIRAVQSGQIDVAVRSTLFGMKDNRAIGEGSEFHQLRDFTRGMDVGSIDWKRSARYGNLLAKEMRAERNHHVILALDNGYLMREEVEGLPKIDHAVNAALAVGWAAAISGDLIGLYAFDARPRLFLPPQAGRPAFARLRSRTAELDYTSAETNHTLAMAELNVKTPRRSLIVVFSDFVDTTTAELLVENVSVLSKRHAIVFVALRDPGLEAVTRQAPESLNDAARAVSAGQMLRERRTVMERLARLGVTVIDVEPKLLTTKLVSTYLDLKAREVI